MQNVVSQSQEILHYNIKSIILTKISFWVTRIDNAYVIFFVITVALIE